METLDKELGGPGSGHHGHAGREGKVGGSLPAKMGAITKKIPQHKGIPAFPARTLARSVHKKYMSSLRKTGHKTQARAFDAL